MFWRTFNPFQHGVEDLEVEQKMALLLQENDAAAAASKRRSSDRRRHGLSNHAHIHFRNNQRNEPFCLGWEREDALNRTLQPFDHWWVHHPTWVISNETDDMFCVEPGKDLALMQSFETFYDTQFKSGCGKIHWRIMWSSGWGADMMNVQVS
jgi:hypothetical protein